MRILITILIRRMRTNTTTTLRHPIPLLEPRPREPFLNLLQNLLTTRRRTTAKPGNMAQLRQKFLDHWVPNHADDDRGDEHEFFDLVLDDRGEHGFHGERRKHVDVCVHEDWEVKDVHEAGDVEEGKDGQCLEHFAWFFWGRDLLDLVGLGDDVAVGNHYLAVVSLCVGMVWMVGTGNAYGFW